MERMLEYIKKLSEINTDGVEPLTNVISNDVNVFREDIVNNNDMKEELLANAPEKYDGMFVVPKTV